MNNLTPIPKCSVTIYYEVTRRYLDVIELRFVYNNLDL